MSLADGTRSALSQIRKSAEDSCSTIVNLQSDILWPFWAHVEKMILHKFIRVEKYRRAVRRRRRLKLKSTTLSSNQSVIEI